MFHRSIRVRRLEGGHRGDLQNMHAFTECAEYQRGGSAMALAWRAMCRACASRDASCMSGGRPHPNISNHAKDTESAHQMPAHNCASCRIRGGLLLSCNGVPQGLKYFAGGPRLSGCVSVPGSTDRISWRFTELHVSGPDPPSTNTTKALEVAMSHTHHVIISHRPHRYVAPQPTRPADGD
jgi:hypothetical protein